MCNAQGYHEAGLQLRPWLWHLEYLHKQTVHLQKLPAAMRDTARAAREFAPVSGALRRCTTTSIMLEDMAAASAQWRKPLGNSLHTIVFLISDGSGCSERWWLWVDWFRKARSDEWVRRADRKTIMISLRACFCWKELSKERPIFKYHKTKIEGMGAKIWPSVEEGRIVGHHSRSLSTRRDCFQKSGGLQTTWKPKITWSDRAH